MLFRSGELSAIDGQPRTASVVATEDSLLAVLPSERFVDLLKGHGEIAFRLMGMLAAIIRRGNELVVESGTGEAINRIYTELLRLAEPDPKSQGLLIVDPLPSLRDLANQTGTTRELVASALNRLYPENIVRRKGRSLYIIDPEALQRAVDSA